MNVGVGVLWAIDLDNPVDSWEIDTSSRDIRTQHYCVLLLNELEVNGSTLVLILLSMEFKQILRDLERLESFICEADLLSG